MSHFRSASLPMPLGDRLGLLIEVGDFFRRLWVAAFHPYRPEQHYMRGPGPACRARHKGDLTLARM